MATKERNVRAQINGLKVDESARFPLARYDYVLSCRTRLQKSTGKRFASTTNDATAEVEITRMQ